LPTRVTGDPGRFAQVLGNLVRNALKFTQQGQVRVVAQQLPSIPEELNFRIEVQDTGIGIKPEVLTRLFTAFTQADSSTTREFGGTGLGLAIVKRLCEMMGGECGVTSEYGVGSCFWFTLRLPRGTESRGETSTRHSIIVMPELPTTDTQLPRILVVEDNLVNQEVVLAMLEALHCTAQVVENGRLAVDALTHPHEFEMVLMDCQMPVLDGFAATREFRFYEQHEQQHGRAKPRLPIVALTANAMRGDREACIAAGMDDFLSKPFQMKDLAAMLQRWCPRFAVVQNAQNVGTPIHQKADNSAEAQTHETVIGTGTCKPLP
jgi:CheY-like chemotaxis protein